MDLSLILKHVRRHVQPSPEEEQLFTSLLTERRLRKKDILQEEGKPCTYLNYVNEGILQAYHRDSNDHSSIIMFAMPDWWVTDMNAFAGEKPAMLFIEALSDSVVLRLEKKGLEDLYLKAPVFERYFRILMQNAYIREQLRIIQNLSLPASQRYENFLKKYPQVVNQVPLKQIASYLGITPEFLSVLRKKTP